MRRREFNLAEIYFFAKRAGKEEAIAKYRRSYSTINQIVATGDDIVEALTKQGKVSAECKQAIDKFTPRELMEELARRGYRGKLQYTQEIDITKF